jgi:hypothetical protein
MLNIILLIITIILFGLLANFSIYKVYVKAMIRKIPEFEIAGNKINKAINKSKLSNKEKFYLIILLLEEFAEQEHDLRTKDVNQLILLKSQGKELNLGEQLIILADELKALLEIQFK